MTKHEMRQEAVERLQKLLTSECRYGDVMNAVLGDAFIYNSPRQDALSLIDLLTDDDPSADEYTKLPRDENGEVIHIGDEMERGTKRGRVVALMLSNYPQKWGGGIHWGVQLEGEQAPTALDSFFHHYHKPTVEDVLREFAIACEDTGNAGPEVQRLASEYAKRLQLKEDE